MSQLIIKHSSQQSHNCHQLCTQWSVKQHFESNYKHNAQVRISGRQWLSNCHVDLSLMTKCSVTDLLLVIWLVILLKRFTLQIRKAFFFFAAYGQNILTSIKWYLFLVDLSWDTDFKIRIRGLYCHWRTLFNGSSRVRVCSLLKGFYLEQGSSLRDYQKILKTSRLNLFSKRVPILSDQRTIHKVLSLI